MGYAISHGPVNYFPAILPPVGFQNLRIFRNYDWATLIDNIYYELPSFLPFRYSESLLGEPGSPNYYINNYVSRPTNSYSHNHNVLMIV